MLQIQYNKQLLAWGVGALCALGTSAALAAPDPAGGVVVQPDSVGAAMDGQSFIDPQLKILWTEYLRRGGNLAAPADTDAKGFIGPKVVDGVVRIEAMSTGDDAALVADLKRLGATDVRQQGNLVLGRIAVGGLGALRSLRTARFVRPAPEPFGSVGSVTSQGDAVQGSERVRRFLGLDGSGVVVGVTSTGYDTQGGAAADVARGDLPGPGNPNGRLQPVRVLKDRNGPDSDEGRAMAQIIHDVAPGASLAVYIPENVQDHADGLRALARAGANVISDDMLWTNDPWFQESPIGVAHREILARQNVVSINAAANLGDWSAEGNFRPLPARDLTVRGFAAGRWQLHDWGGGKTTFPVTVHRGGRVRIVMQWDEPFASFTPSRAGSASDLDLFAFTEAQGSNIAFLSAARNVGGDPVEYVFAFLNPDATDETFTIHIGVGMPEGVGSLPGRFKLIAEPNDMGVVDWPRDAAFHSATAVGHNASEGAIIACAVRYSQVNTPRGPVAEPFSSTGGFARTRDADGNLLPRPLDTHKPDLCAPDGVDTSFFGFDIDGNGWPNFLGTSAASPHLAGVAALMLQASGMKMRAAEVAPALRETARDMVDFSDPLSGPGYDLRSGYGFVNADLAVARAMALRYRP
ncbi:S8 family peptidase [Paracidovorax konjaci]|uniref:Subtilase family protein n=1 Tax=Paracidovorax konjaci TaxID=32040 RepID=A0A1I1VEI8_9BURK|nr:S8 family serine peptidase [Paracidovorax konjaci]SFD81356.1 Subtilase family protein [Paracidovorax konjaci]